MRAFWVEACSFFFNQPTHTMKYHIHYTGQDTARYTTTLDLWLDAERAENVTEDVTIIADLFISEITEDDDGKPLPLWAVGYIVTSHCCGRKICEDDEDLIIQSFLQDLSSLRAS